MNNLFNEKRKVPTIHSMEIEINLQMSKSIKI